MHTAVTVGTEYVAAAAAAAVAATYPPRTCATSASSSQSTYARLLTAPEPFIRSCECSRARTRVRSYYASTCMCVHIHNSRQTLTRIDVTPRCCIRGSSFACALRYTHSRERAHAGALYAYQARTRARELLTHAASRVIALRIHTRVRICPFPSADINHRRYSDLHSRLTTRVKML